MLVEVKDGLFINTDLIKKIKLTQTNELDITMIDGENIWIENNGKEILEKLRSKENGN